jgi:hypothetical protein
VCDEVYRVKLNLEDTHTKQQKKKNSNKKGGF